VFLGLQEKLAERFPGQNFSREIMTTSLLTHRKMDTRRCSVSLRREFVPLG
jgi:hypothetical protein